MKYTIHSQQDRLVDVTMDDEQGLVIRKKMELIKYGVDVLVPAIDKETDEPLVDKEGNPVMKLELQMVDPFDDIGAYLETYLQKYKDGKAREEAEKNVPQLPLEEEFFHSPQVNSDAEEAAAE